MPKLAGNSREKIGLVISSYGSSIFSSIAIGMRLSDFTRSNATFWLKILLFQDYLLFFCGCYLPRDSISDMEALITPLRSQFTDFYFDIDKLRLLGLLFAGVIMLENWSYNLGLTFVAHCWVEKELLTMFLGDV